MAGASPLVLVTLVVAGLTGWLVRGYLDAVLVAAVVTILLAPLHDRVLRWTGGRRRLASALTLLGFTLGVFVPAAFAGFFVGREVVVLANEVAAQVELGQWDDHLRRFVASGPMRWAVDLAGGRTALLDGLETAVRDGVLNLAATVTQNVPGLLSVTAGLVLKLVVFFLATTTFLARRHELLDLARRASPLAPGHTDRLVSVFVEFARNVVLAGLVAGLLQGVVATLGFWLADVERALLFGVLTAVFAYVPLVGTALVWVPVCVLLLAADRAGAAAFVAVWSLALTGTVDNMVRPFIVKGRSDVPLLLVFLGAFGGLASFGVIGILVGPVIVAMLLALLHIYVAEREGGGPATPRDGSPANTSAG